MQRNILLLTVFLLNSFLTVQAQKATLKLSPEMKIKKSETFGNHLRSDETGHYVYFLKSKRKGLMGVSTTVNMKKYDTKFKEVWSKDFLADQNGVSSFGLKSTKDKFLWALSEESKKVKTESYYILPIDKNGETGKKVKIQTVRYEKGRDVPYFSWELSKDSSKVGTSLYLDNNKKKYNFEYSVKVLDSDLNELWSKKVKLRKSQEQIQVISTLIGNDGAHYMLVKEYDDRKAKETKKGKDGKQAAYSIKLYRLSEGLEKPEIIKLDLGGKFLKGASLDVSETGEITCIGMFAENRSKSINGVFYLKMDKTGEVIKSNLKEFSISQLGHLGNRNRKKSKGKEGVDGNFRFGEQIIAEDGSITITAEENYSITRTPTNTGTGVSISRSVTTYYSLDIIVMNIDPEGVINSLNVIPKRQVFREIKMFNSYTALPVDGHGVFFFYNDDEDNMKKPITSKAKRISSFGDCVIASTQVDEKGKLKRKSLVDAKKVKALMIPGDSKRIAPNTLFFVAMKPKLLRKSNFRMGTIEIK